MKKYVFKVKYIKNGICKYQKFYLDELDLEVEKIKLVIERTEKYENCNFAKLEISRL